MSALRKLPSASQPDTSIAEIIDDVKKPLSLCKAEEKLDQLRQRHTALSQQIALVLDQADVNGRLHPDLKSVERDARAEKASVEREINKACVEVMAGRRAHDGEIRKAIAPWLEQAKNRLAETWDETNTAWTALEGLRQQTSNCGYTADKSTQPGKFNCALVS